eukprot:476647_1
MNAFGSILICLCHYASSTVLTEWTTYNTMPTGISGAIAAYDWETTDMIYILSPGTNYGRAFWQFDIHSNDFISPIYPNCHINGWVTNAYAQYDSNQIYFMDILQLPGSNTLYAFSLSERKLLMNYSLPNDGYSENPCLVKSNDGKYLFILGGQSMADTNPFYDTFYIYDFTNHQIKGQGTRLPHPAFGFGCYVDVENYLHIIGGMYSIGKQLYESKTVWSIDVENIDNWIENTTQWRISNVSLPYWPSLPFITEVYNRIYIIGGSCSDQVHYFEFDGNNENAINLFAALTLPTALCFPTGITVNYTIFLFGGNNGTEELKMPLTWMKSNDMKFTDAPTHHPTNSPTNSPTNAPTHSPTMPPSQPPTNTPTHSSIGKHGLSGIIYMIIGAGSILLVIGLIFILRKCCCKRQNQAERQALIVVNEEGEGQSQAEAVANHRVDVEGNNVLVTAE